MLCADYEDYIRVQEKVSETYLVRASKMHCRLLICFRATVCKTLRHMLSVHVCPVCITLLYCGHGRPSQLLLSSCYVCGSRVVVAVVVVVVVVFVVVVVVKSATKFKYVSNRSKLCKGMTLVECSYHGLNQ